MVGHESSGIHRTVPPSAQNNRTRLWTSFCIFCIGQTEAIRLVRSEAIDRPRSQRSWSRSPRTACWQTLHRAEGRAEGADRNSTEKGLTRISLGAVGRATYRVKSQGLSLSYEPNHLSMNMFQGDVLMTWPHALISKELGRLGPVKSYRNYPGSWLKPSPLCVEDR